MNRFDGIRAFYAEIEDQILAAPRNEYPPCFSPWCWEGVIEFTPIEMWFWEEISNANAILYPQYPVGRFFVDFGHPVAKIAFECDGAAYHLDKEKDAARDRELNEMGWSVYRLTGKECAKEQNPESSEPTFARLYLEAIAASTGIKRKGSWHLPQLRTPEWRDLMGRELPERVGA